MAPVSIRTPAGILDRAGFDNYGKLRCAGLLINLGSNVVVLPPFVGSVVQVSAVAVARTLSI